ncbi:MAG: carbohydrate ABC transporter substrate-binding protein [Geminicoccaceae bacterium]|nr:carbohydrate ABC transporter substrate-binding protein [Geminicoccaceae bacterium]MCB9943110.1 carbohydrate ABC transporter substrate-binding protein [Geminicoccaceae bacterium]
MAIRLTRRDSMILGAGALAGTALGGPVGLRAQIPAADVAPPDLPIEDGASLTLLRPTKFVATDEEIWLANTKKFTEATGVPVKVEFEGWEDVPTKTAVAANVGSGPDVVIGFADNPFLYKDKLHDLSDITSYLGKKYGGWWPLAERYGVDPDTGKWIAMPVGASGGRIVYRKSMLEAAGFSEVPGDVDGFLEMAKALQANGTPMGLAVGNAPGDGNAWTHWLVWSHGGKVADDDSKLIIDSPETVAALEYGKKLYETFIPGTLSWLDANNNKAFLAQEISLTQNGISVYYAAKTSEDPAIKALAEDIFHARMPVGPVGIPTERCLVFNSMIFDYTPYPNAAKAYLTFMMESPQYGEWLEKGIGYFNHPLQAYDASPVWTNDPKHEAYKHVMKDAVWDGYSGRLGPESAATLADFIIVQMVASVCSGQATPEEAAAEAQRRASRYYRS